MPRAYSRRKMLIISPFLIANIMMDDTGAVGGRLSIESSFFLFTVRKKLMRDQSSGLEF